MLLPRAICYLPPMGPRVRLPEGGAGALLEPLLPQPVLAQKARCRVGNRVWVDLEKAFVAGAVLGERWLVGGKHCTAGRMSR